MELFPRSPRGPRDTLSIALDGLRATRAAAEDERKRTDRKLIPVRIAQEHVAAEFREQVLGPREQAWYALTDELSAQAPVDIVERRDDYLYLLDGTLVWQFDYFDTSRDARVTLTAAATIGLDEKPELRSAFGYLTRGDVAFHRQRVPDELLGVPATRRDRNGHRVAKHIPRADLLSKVTEACLADADRLEVSAYAKLLGADGQKILDTRVNRRGFSPEHILLKSTHAALAESILGEFRTHHRLQRLTPQNIANHLRSKFYTAWSRQQGWIVGEDFEKLAQATDWLKEALPLVVKQPANT